MYYTNSTAKRGNTKAMFITRVLPQGAICITQAAWAKEVIQRQCLLREYYLRSDMYCTKSNTCNEQYSGIYDCLNPRVTQE